MTKYKLPPKINIASFDVDCQYTFTPECPNELPVADALAIVPELNAQAELANYRLGSKDAHSPHAIWIADAQNPQFTPVEGEHVDIRWVSHAIVGTKGFQLIKGLPEITAYDFFVWKGIEPDMHPYGTCYHDLNNTLSTGVIEFLRDKQVTTIIVGGLATDYCVKNTVLQLLAANFEVILNLAGARGIAKETIDAAIAEMRAQGAIIINGIHELG
ncbi:MAG: nicotinamidase [Legionellales bacterium]|nr:nicotinamidase [Legionellales bacterium]|tara:strand:- start:59 stop:703 length:645 start_codon:yes stop_codon:yes gene_type:complete